jgi:UDP-N-acetylmuramoyl-tripeptide--D-alanyl-D-alanine ligase
MQRIPLPEDVVVLNDSYNANPQSMEVALRSLAELETAGRRIAVLGDMGELGTFSTAAHRAAGQLAAELGIERLFALGASSEDMMRGALDAGMTREAVMASRDAAELAACVRATLRPGDAVLVKGSRSMRMEQIVDALTRSDAAPAPEPSEVAEVRR